jgi:tetratricopeptide (TPR) repeat protein
MRYCRFIYTLAITLLPFVGIAGADPFLYTPQCARAYNMFMALDMEGGSKMIAAERRSNPGNMMAVYIEDYEDCLELLMNCNLATYKKRSAFMDARLTLMAQAEDSSPWYRFCYSGMYLHRAIVNIRFGEQYRAAYNFRKSFALLRENERLHPDFAFNNVIGGLLEAVVGSLPGNYKWLAAVFGMKGSVQKGTDKLEAFLHNHQPTAPLYAETYLYYLYCRFYLLSQQEEVWSILSGNGFITHNNLLNTYVKANMALDYRHADDALQTLVAARERPDYKRYPIFEYQTGYALLINCDTACAASFSHYLATNQSDLFIKDSWQKMAFAWYVNGRNEKAKYCRDKIKDAGSTRIDADKQAARFAAGGVWPNRQLLQARLYIDGGYYQRALDILQKIDEHLLTSPADRAEYHFRLGRVYEEMAIASGKSQYTKQALARYRDAMTEGKDRKEQFAARAALHMGKIYERLGIYAEAVTMYRLCLDMPEHDFQNSIDQQAKSGISRIEHRQGGKQ